MKLALTTEYNAKNCVPSTVGCDGVKGSGKTLDACGVCGGTATTCDCAGRTIQHKASNGAYVNNWAYDGTQSFSSSARCDPDSNSDWSSNGASISCGYAP